MQVNLSLIFKSYLNNFPKSDRLKLANFINHVQKHGLQSLEGRNKSSENLPTDDSRWLDKVKQAQKYNLWHYHIGIPNYSGVSGDKTSEFVLHYMLDEANDCITIVYMSPHPPFDLPDKEYLLLD